MDDNPIAQLSKQLMMKEYLLPEDALVWAEEIMQADRGTSSVAFYWIETGEMPDWSINGHKPKQLLAQLGKATAVFETLMRFGARR